MVYFVTSLISLNIKRGLIVFGYYDENRLRFMKNVKLTTSLLRNGIE